jgi:F-type H+-transporting ATPase subunit delta
MDSKTFQIAQNYAMSLFETCLEKHEIESFHDQLNFVALELINSKTFQSFARTPHIPVKEKLKALNNALENSNANILIQKFVLSLIQNRRFYLLPAILICFKKIKNLHTTTCKVTAISANRLEESLKNSLTSALTCILKKPLEIKFKEDKSLIGGLVIEFDKYVIDTSIKNKIDRIFSISN